MARRYYGIMSPEAARWAHRETKGKTMGNTMALPTAAEIETITPIIAAEFRKADVACGGFTRPRQGGLMMAAHVGADKWRGLESALFAHGIVMVAINPTLTAFAVRR